MRFIVSIAEYGTDLNWKFLIWLLSSITAPLIFTFYNQQKIKKISSGIFNFLLHVTWIFYAVILLFVFAKHQEVTTFHSILSTLYWLMPVQVIVIGINWFLIKKNDRIAQSDSIDISPAQAILSEDNFIKYCKQLLRSQDMLGLFQICRVNTTDFPALLEAKNEISLLEGQWNSSETDFRRGVITREEFRVEKNRIIDSISNLLKLNDI